MALSPGWLTQQLLHHSQQSMESQILEGQDTLSLSTKM